MVDTFAELPKGNVCRTRCISPSLSDGTRKGTGAGCFFVTPGPQNLPSPTFLVQVISILFCTKICIVIVAYGVLSPQRLKPTSALYLYKNHEVSIKVILDV
jgi:hypothetical protein